MRFCIECFKDQEIRAAIEALGARGKCQVCGSDSVWVYDCEYDTSNSDVEERIGSILEIYVPESELDVDFPQNECKYLVDHMYLDWKIFSGERENIAQILRDICDNLYNISDKILTEKVGIPQLNDEGYMLSNSIMGKYAWKDFKHCLRNENRFHNSIVNLEILAEILKGTETYISANINFYRARVSNEKGKSGFKRSEMGAPPDDVASAGRANSKGQSCLYLASNRDTTIKEIRAHAFDYVTIATFRLKRDIKVLDLGTITHSSPFYTENDKVTYLVNERILAAMEYDMAQPMSRWDSELDYLPTQYISDLAKTLGFDGVKYLSTFDKNVYNLALFNPDICRCTYHKNYRIDNLNYKILRTDKF